MMIHARNARNGASPGGRRNLPGELCNIPKDADHYQPAYYLSYDALIPAWLSESKRANNQPPVKEAKEVINESVG